MFTKNIFPILLLILLAGTFQLDATETETLPSEDAVDVEESVLPVDEPQFIDEDPDLMKAEKEEEIEEKKIEPKKLEKDPLMPNDYKDEFPPSEPCEEYKCRLPNCRCSETDYPKESFADHPDDVPQFIVLSFDDAVNSLNYPKYKDLLDGLRNADNCSVLATFFLSHEYTDYSAVNALYTQGHEIALHSVTHSTQKNFWRDADVDVWMQEINNQLAILERFAYVKKKDVEGMRLPFLQTSGDSSFIAAKKCGLTYDSSMPTLKYTTPPMWPYTLDYRSVQECLIGKCPEASIPGFWVSPMIPWVDAEGRNCAVVDACHKMPEDDHSRIFEWIMKNFRRHYDTNHAPFNIALHANFFNTSPNNVLGLKEFLQHVITLPNVYITTMSEVIKYMRNPVLGKPFQTCRKVPTTKRCFPRTCILKKESTEETRYFTGCGQCPKVYPWVDNPLGLLNKFRN